MHMLDVAIAIKLVSVIENVAHAANVPVYPRQI